MKLGLSLNLQRVALTVLSFGGGQDSTTILYKLAYDPAFRKQYAPGHLLVIMADTGDEHPHTLHHVVDIQTFCHKHGIEFVHLTASMGYHSPAWPNIIEPQSRAEGGEFEPTLIQLGTKTCTIKVKVDPIYKYLDAWINRKFEYGFKVNPKTGGCGKQAIKEFYDDYGPIQVLIGFAAGEETRVEKSRRLEASQLESLEDSFWKAIRRVFPLVDLGLTREACQAYIRQMGHAVPLPSNCMRCPYMSAEELYWLYLNHPEKLDEWVQWERNKLARHKDAEKNHGVFNTKKTILDRLEAVQKKYAHLDRTELDRLLNDWKMNHGCGSGSY